MNDGEHYQQLAQLSGELRDVASRELMAALRKDGATEKEATQACEEIASYLAAIRMWRESDRTSFDQVGLVRELLTKLQQSLNSLTPESEGMLQHYLSAEHGAQVPETEDYRRKNWEYFNRLTSAIPTLVELLPPRPPRKGGHDAPLHWAAQRACLSWRRATGRWPPATKSEDSSKTASLYQFLTRHSGREGFSLDTWARIVRGIKRSEGQRT
jgi:hypothetical protein